MDEDFKALERVHDSVAEELEQLRRAAKIEAESRAMFVARIKRSYELMSVDEILGLLNDCDMLAQRANSL